MVGMLENIEQLRNIPGDYARTYLWDIHFPAAPDPFNNWFPADTCEEPDFRMNEHPFTMGISEYHIPLHYDENTLEITCFDNEIHALEMWFTDWVKNIMFGGGQYVSSLAGCVGECFVMRLSPQRKVIRKMQYSVYPCNSLSSSWDSESKAKKLSLRLRVAGSRECSIEGTATTESTQTHIQSGFTGWVEIR